MVTALLLAASAEKVMRGKTFYRTLLIWPDAVAPAVAGMLFLFMFNPAMGSFAYVLRRNGAPDGPARDILSSVTICLDGRSLLMADDVEDVIWRVSAA